MMSAHVDPDNEHALGDVSTESDLSQQFDPVIEDVVIEDVDVVLLEDEQEQEALPEEAESTALSIPVDDAAADESVERLDAGDTVSQEAQSPAVQDEVPLQPDALVEAADDSVASASETELEDAGIGMQTDSLSIAVADESSSQSDASEEVLETADADDETQRELSAQPIAPIEASSETAIDESAAQPETAEPTAAAEPSEAEETAKPEEAAAASSPDAESVVRVEEAPAETVAPESEPLTRPAGKSSPAEDKLRLCEQSLGYTFFDKKLIKNALTHSSSTSDKRLDNERLEFFGDAVLDLIIREYLYHNYPNHQEGDLTEAKSAVVCRASLAKASKKMELKSFLFLGRGIGKKRAVPESLLADAYEAIVAAIYLDGGYQPARNFVLMTLKDEIPGAMQAANSTNFKSNLQKYLQQQKRPLPVYKVLGATGPEHSRVFEVAAVIEGEELGRGTGSSKKAAEQEAARIALEKLEPDSE